jgi:hypothetical protein
MPQNKGSTALTEPPETVVAHGGNCPPGYIFDHNKNSPSYGKCISVVAKKGNTLLTSETA